MTNPTTDPHSPPWGATIKLVIGLTLVAIVAALVIRFQSLIGPLLLAFILTYLLHPLASTMTRTIPVSWRTAVNIIFLILIILLLGSFTLTGLAAVQQLESLINLVQRFVTDLPDLVENFISQVYQIGPYQIDLSLYLSQTDLDGLTQQLLGVVQPILGQAGGLLSSIASSTLSVLGQLLLVVLVSYFVLADMGRIPDKLVNLELPGYDADIRRLGKSLGRIWNAFLRGQVILFAMSVTAYIVLMTILGVRYGLALALLAGLARFVPYVGPFVTWTATALVVFFQKSNYFGLEPWQYVILVLGLAILVDQIFDNMISPRILGQTLGIHPAAVLVAAVVAANLLGLVGVVLAAPVLSSLTLIGRYAMRKMVDLDPWVESEESADSFETFWARWRRRATIIWRWFYQIFNSFRRG